GRWPGWDGPRSGPAPRQGPPRIRRSLRAVATARSIEPAGSRADGAIGLRRDQAGRTALGLAVADDGIAIGWRRARLEGLENDTAAARPGAQTGLQVDADELEARRHPERHARLVGQRHLQEVAHDRRREMATGRPAGEMARLVI